MLVAGKGERNTIKLDGWELTFSAYLDSLLANPTDQNLPDKDKKRAAAVMDELEKTFEFCAAATPQGQQPADGEASVPRKMKPGEYSIHRLFAAISGMFSPLQHGVPNCRGPMGRC